jgi:FG-GAP-like repeat
MKKFIIAILVLSVVAVVWASRTPKKTSDYGDSACDSTPEIFGSGPAQQSIKGVQVLSEQICDGGSGSFPLNCSTSVRDFVYLVSLPSNSPQVITRFAISVSGAPSGFNPNFGLMLCSSGPASVFCTNSSSLFTCANGQGTPVQSGSTWTVTWSFPCSGNAFKAGSQLAFYVGFTPATGIGTPAPSLSVSTATTSPAVSTSVPNLAFGPTSVGSTSASQNVTVSNNGTSTASITRSVSGPFSVLLTSATTCGGSSHTSPFSLAPGASCVLALNFKPTTSASAVGSLNLSNTESDSPHTVSLVGNGLFKAVSLPSIYGNGMHPLGVTVADVNKDGKADVVLAGCPAKVGVQLGSGTGTFSSPVLYDTGSSGCSYILSRDFNNDGWADLATGNPDGSVSVLINDKTGKFPGANLSTVSIGSNPVTNINTGDMNGDGKIDIVATVPLDGTLSLLPGDGSGFYTSSQQILASTTDKPSAVSVRDFNNDTKQDLAVTYSATNKLAILIGIGDGTFHTPVLYSVGSNPVALISTDFNGDGKADVAVVNQNSNNVMVFLGTGTGTLLTPKTYNVGTTPVAIRVGDFNKDGKTDIAVVNRGSNNVTVLLGKGDGTFYSAGSYYAGLRPKAIFNADFNGDGKQDVVVVNEKGLGVLLHQ